MRRWQWVPTSSVIALSALLGALVAAAALSGRSGTTSMSDATSGLASFSLYTNALLLVVTWHVGSRMARDGRAVALTLSARPLSARVMSAIVPAVAAASIYTAVSLVIAILVVRPVADVGVHHVLYLLGLFAMACTFALLGMSVGLRFPSQVSGFVAGIVVFGTGFALEIALRTSKWSAFAPIPVQVYAGTLPAVGPTLARILLAAGLVGGGVAMIGGLLVPRPYRRIVQLRLVAIPAVIGAVGVAMSISPGPVLIDRPVAYVCQGSAPRVCLDVSHLRELHESALALQRVARRSGSVLIDPEATVREDLHQRDGRGLSMQGTASRYADGGLTATETSILWYLVSRLDESACSQQLGSDGWTLSTMVLRFVLAGVDPDEAAAFPAMRPLAAMPDEEVRSWVEAHSDAILNCRLVQSDLVP